MNCTMPGYSSKSVTLHIDGVLIVQKRCCCFCGFKAQQCLGQRYDLHDSFYNQKAPFPHEAWSPASSASFGIRTHDPHARGRVL